METSGRASVAALFAAALSLPVAPAASADGVGDFYKGKQVTVLVASDAAGLAGLYGRVVGENVVRNIPGKPTAVLQFMPGAGGTRGANYCYNAAAKDGTVICQLSQSVPAAQPCREPASATTPPSSTGSASRRSRTAWSESGTPRR